MEDNKPVINVETDKNVQKEIKLSLSEKVMNSFFAIIALILLAITKVLSYFVFSPTLTGIMAILIFGLSITGLLWNYIKFHKPTIAFYFSAGVAFLTLLAL